jgi:transcriptional regulator with XRE-family HTH domain
MLNETTVKNIKSDIEKGNLTQKQIGEKYNISRSMVSDIACGRSYNAVPATVDDEIIKLKAEVAHLREEKNLANKRLKHAVKNKGLFQAITDEMETRINPFTPLPTARGKVKPTKNQTVEHLVMHLSDGHHDQVVTYDDTGGLEKYNFPISVCRAERYVDTIIKWTQQTLAPQFRFPSLTVLSYGDHTSGEIHGAAQRSYFKNMFRNCQAIGQLHALMFRDLAPYFDQVNVISVPGNHGRRSTKKDYHGAHDNWDYLIAKFAQLYCGNVGNINFQIPNSFSCNVEIDGVGFNIAHGDDVRSNLGIPWYGLERRRYRMMALDNVRDGVPIRYYCCGHFHRPGNTTDVNGEMIMNGAWPASDAFAYNACAGYTTPSQLIHGVNRKYGITWRLPVMLKSEYEHNGPKRYFIDEMESIQV